MALFTKETPAPRPQQARPSDSATPFDGTLVGPNVTIEGTLTGSEAVLIEGTVKGRIHLQSDVRVGTQGRVEATVHARNVTIEGKVNGDVSADDRIELIATSTVDGNLKAPKIVVAEGARFRGNVDMGSTKPVVNAEAATIKK